MKHTLDCRCDGNGCRMGAPRVKSKPSRGIIKERMAHHLIWVWYQYGGGDQMPDGRVFLPHKNMSAGEDAGDLLAELGYGVDRGYHIELTDKGIALMDRDFV